MILFLKLLLQYPSVLKSILRYTVVLIAIVLVFIGICYAIGEQVPKFLLEPITYINQTNSLGISPWNLTLQEQEVLGSVIMPENIDETFDSIGGNDHIVDHVQQLVIKPFKSKETKYSDKILLKPPNGILLYGTPGTGKTMIARAIASELGGAFINVTPDLVENKYFGESQKIIKAVFSLADKLKPCVIFIDEIDGLLGKRSMLDQSHVNSCKTQFLSMMDGVNKRDENVIVIGATNNIVGLDPAVKRRMRLQLEVNLPNQEDRQKIFEKIIPLAEVCEDIDMEGLAGITEGFSGSDINEMCKLAAQFALKNNRDIITQDDFVESQLTLG